MPRAVDVYHDVYHVEVIFFDDAIEMDIDEVQPWRGTPVSKESWLDVFQGQRFLQQGIVKKIDLADGEVIGRPPIGMHGFQLRSRKRLRHGILLLYGSHRCVSP
jgi:hypothetical protein